MVDGINFPGLLIGSIFQNSITLPLIPKQLVNKTTSYENKNRKYSEIKDRTHAHRW